MTNYKYGFIIKKTIFVDCSRRPYRRSIGAGRTCDLGPFPGVYAGHFMKEYRPTVGEDGKIYFKYNLGAVFELRPEVGAPFRYKVLACEFEDGEEVYRIDCDGVELPTRLSESQLEFMLGRLHCETIEEGEAVELPLLPEEIEKYFGAKRKELNRRNVAANNALKETDYFKNKSAIERLTERLRLARAEGDSDKVSKLGKQLEDLEGEQFVILSEKNVDFNILHKVADCQLCGDKGILSDGSVCACARAQTAAIKLFNAEIRLAAKAAAV